MTKYLSYAKKALVGGGTAALGVLAASADGGLTRNELLLAAGAFVTGALGVFFAKNGDRPARISAGDIE